MFTRTNILARRFAECSVAMKVKLFIKSVVLACMMLSVYKMGSICKLMSSYNNNKYIFMSISIDRVFLKFYGTQVSRVLVPASLIPVVAVVFICALSDVLINEYLFIILFILLWLTLQLLIVVSGVMRRMIL